LTQISNRLELDYRLNTEFANFQRNGVAFTVLMIDIDNFKRVNDTFGHIVGDDTLIKFTHLVRAQLRTTDSFGRWGGDEFLIILPRTSGREGISLANTLRRKVSESSDFIDFTVTLSIGITELKEGDTIENLLTRSDQALYKAKDGGRDQVYLEE
jgi:polar amino acid transport system substrate-binding protein